MIVIIIILMMIMMYGNDGDIVEHECISSLQPLNNSFANSLPKLDEASKIMIIIIMEVVVMTLMIMMLVVMIIEVIFN